MKERKHWSFDVTCIHFRLSLMNWLYDLVELMEKWLVTISQSFPTSIVQRCQIAHSYNPCSLFSNDDGTISPEVCCGLLLYSHRTFIIMVLWSCWDVCRFYVEDKNWRRDANRAFVISNHAPRQQKLWCGFPFGTTYSLQLDGGVKI